MSRTYKRFKGRLSKQMLAEQEFERGREFPGEIPNCNCEMIFINERDLENV